MKCYKLVTQGLKAYGGFKYTLGVWTPKLDGTGDLCTKSWYHVYDNPLLAVLLNVLHGILVWPKLFECTYDGRLHTVDDRGLKRGVVKLRLDKELPLPVITPEQCVRAAIYCTRPLQPKKPWADWAKSWLNGKDRTCLSAIHIQRVIGPGSWSKLKDTVKTANAAALASASAAQYATHLAKWTWSLRGWGSRATARAIERAAQFAWLIKKPQNSAYFVGLVEKAIADENKLQKGRAA